jgi:hypothetical protein
MTIDQVIQAGNIHVNNFPAWIFWVGMFSIFIGGTISFFYEKEGLSKFIFFLMLPFALLCGYLVNQDMEEESSLVTKWKQEVAMSFIQSLPTEKHEVVFIKIEPQLSHNVQSSLLRYTYSVPVKLTPLTISFKGNGIETYTDWYEAHMELTKEQQPYVTYKKLDRDLGNGIQAGMFDVKVYLPESYKFTDIK